MCGIAGYFNPDQNYAENPKQNFHTLSRMINTMNHRGPDTYGHTIINSCSHEMVELIHLARSQPVVSPRKRRLMKQSPNCRTCYSLTERELYMDIPMKSRTISRGTSPELSRWLTRNLWSLRPTSDIPYAGLIDSQCNLT